ncbi:MAG: hypothetical protein EBU34_00615 [Alphaproteobacteria bacterium]|jgi:hypothetical protein|nr:hypothetical protein [Alphaproteobacteria bacterium]
MTHWWLTIFFLIGDQWISGDQLDGWASRSYETFEECEERRLFGEQEVKSLVIPYNFIWICNEGIPAKHLSV